MPLEEGIPRRGVVQEHRAANPEENRPVVNEGDSIGWKTVAAETS